MDRQAELINLLNDYFKLNKRKLIGLYFDQSQEHNPSSLLDIEQDIKILEDKNKAIQNGIDLINETEERLIKHNLELNKILKKLS